MEQLNQTIEQIEDRERDLGIHEQDSTQYNSQDLDQEQNVAVKPLQLNTQNFHAFITEEKKDYSGKITGVTYLKNNNDILSEVTIKLFFGNECEIPVYKTESDKNGRFVLEELPPGYYTLQANYGKHLACKYHCIKVLSCQTNHQSIFLEDNIEQNHSDNIEDTFSKNYKEISRKRDGITYNH